MWLLERLPQFFWLWESLVQVWHIGSLRTAAWRRLDFRVLLFFPLLEAIFRGVRHPSLILHRSVSTWDQNDNPILLELLIFNWGWFCPPGDIWPCVETVLAVTGVGMLLTSNGLRMEMLLNILNPQVSPPTKGLFVPRCQQYGRQEILF